MDDIIQLRYGQVYNESYNVNKSELFFLYDRFAQLQVTINGQLMTMTLGEE